MPMEMPIFFPLVAMAAVAGAAVCAVWMVVRGHARSERHSGRAEIEQLTDAITELRAELDTVRNELADVHERLDFTERVLTRSSGTP